MRLFVLTLFGIIFLSGVYSHESNGGSEGHLCVGEKDGQIFATYDCKKYVLCVDQKDFKVKCAEGLFFDSKSERCKPLAKARCLDVNTPLKPGLALPKKPSLKQLINDLDNDGIADDIDNDDDNDGTFSYLYVCIHNIHTYIHTS